MFIVQEGFFMSIYITGDTHGKVQERFNMRNFPEQRDMSVDDYMIVLGDFGVIWDAEKSSEERYMLSWLEEKPWTTLFIDGNHENFGRLYSSEFETVEFCGGKAQKITDKVYHLLRGESYEIEGKTFFCFGGAASHDIDNLLDPENDPGWKRKRSQLNKQYMPYRVIGKSWWAEELPSEAEKAYALETLDSMGWKCDYVLTHTPAASIVEKFAELNGEDYEPDDASVFLESVKQKLDYRHWFSGHLHKGQDITRKDHIVYREILKLLK